MSRSEVKVVDELMSPSCKGHYYALDLRTKNHNAPTIYLNIHMYNVYFIHLFVYLWISIPKNMTNYWTCANRQQEIMSTTRK